jgi:hypothetical protein
MAPTRSQSLPKAIKWTRNMQEGETDQQLFNELANFQMTKKLLFHFLLHLIHLTTMTSWSAGSDI